MLRSLPKLIRVSSCVLLWACLYCPQVLAADTPAAVHKNVQDAGSLSNRQLSWPSGEAVWGVLTLRDYNTRVVMFSTVVLGMVAGVIGTLMLLRRRALVGDVISHSALPGIGVAFLVMETFWPGSGKSLSGLLLGAFLSGIFGMVCLTFIRKTTRIKEDAALALVLSVFFGLGVVLLTIVQSIPTGSVAGLQGFILGKTASVSADDVQLIAATALVVLVLCGLLFKEFVVLCFDEGYAASQGWPVHWLDLLLLGLVSVVTVIGMQSVGLLLVVALMIVPAAGARFWTDRVGSMAWISALLGAVSAACGVTISTLFPRLPPGPVIVLAATCGFSVSLLIGTKRGVLHRLWHRWALQRRLNRHTLLRACFEHIESALGLPITDAWLQHPFTLPQLSSHRTWPRRRLEHWVSAAEADGLLRLASTGGYCLTVSGLEAARRATRNHRLWELYLMAYADTGLHQVDRSAERIEHVLDPDILLDLKHQLSLTHPGLDPLPPSPHPMES